MDYTQLKAELLSDPLGIGYSTYIPAATGKIAELLNDPNYSKAKSKMITARAILAKCADGATILDKLEAATSANTKVKWTVVFLKQDAGIDIGDIATLNSIDQLTGTLLTSDEAGQLKALAMQPASRAEILGFGRVDSTDIQKALES